MVDQIKLEQSTEAEEDFVDRPYTDSKGLWTFAIGRCLETNPLTPVEWRYLLASKLLSVTIQHEGALWLMRNGLYDAQEQCSKWSFWPKLNDVRQNVLVEMVYQMGIDAIRGTPSKRGFKNFLMALDAGDYEAAALHGLDSKWAKKDSPNRARRLMERMRTGVY